MISVFGWPDPNTGFNQSEYELYTCYFITSITLGLRKPELNFIYAGTIVLSALNSSSYRSSKDHLLLIQC